jgi:hypothetical protein
MVASSRDLAAIGLLIVRSCYSDCVCVGCNLSVFMIYDKFMVQVGK